ncbi:uncharacterized protein [Gossypium hirsutum]|uniref:Retrotransposon gag domain-containing protein n=1 Tax=Gossypium hirsutum TaxID=3635 RepID=A0A1U8KCL5_GOSHI|nr:uncharacterized protein LOC107915607 [Gossypium hirsutum]
METTERCHGIDAKDLSLVPDLVLPYKFKMSNFKKYNGTTCPEAHITIFCRRMTGYVNNDQLLIHCFQDSLTGAASKWYNQLSRARISSWRDLAQVFMKQYSHVVEMVPDRITLQNMEKKSNEGFRQYAQRWREVAVQVQPPLLEREMTMPFVNTLKAPFIIYMLGSATKNFSDIVMSGEMIESAIRSGKIDVGENNRSLHILNGTENLLPNHTDAGVNMVGEGTGKKVKENIAEVKIPLRRVWKEMMKRWLIVSDLVRGGETQNYCDFHHEVGHEIQRCGKSRAWIRA